MPCLQVHLPPSSNILSILSSTLLAFYPSPSIPSSHHCIYFCQCNRPKILLGIACKGQREAEICVSMSHQCTQQYSVTRRWVFHYESKLVSFCELGSSLEAESF
ncbi:hypothetical protein V8G54_033926 [Vigna mungo]|uniref:Uncharacterized protein n=1 Tax=Vigna mungo TaxID=3915 RepID=A0AAQ3MPY0_VIGMU